MSEELKDKIKSVLTTILIVGLVVLSAINYPLFVRVEDGETKCSSLIGKTVKCR